MTDQTEMMEMMPATHNGMPAFLCLSAMQKCIRRGMAKEAMEFACELLHTSKAFLTMACNRLEVICHEDLATVEAPWVVPFVHTACAQARERYKPDKPGEARLMIGNAIRVMCAAPKSRAGCHFAAAVGLGNAIEKRKPDVPDWALDVHTSQGKRMGRGLDHFRNVGAILKDGPTAADDFEAEAYRLWRIKYGPEKSA